MLFRQSFDHVSDQGEWERLGVGEDEIAFGSPIWSQAGNQVIGGIYRRIDSDVFPECGEVEKNPYDAKRWHLIAYAACRRWNATRDFRRNLLEAFPNFG
jgi:hypothetical protein